MIDIPPKVRQGERLKASTINALIDAVRRSRVLQSSTVRVSQSANGTILDVIPRGRVVSGVKAEEKKHPFKLAVFTDENDNKYRAVYIPNGSCNVNGKISSLDNTQRLTAVVDKSEWSEEKIAAFSQDWADYYYFTDDNIYVHVFGTRVVSTENDAVVSDTSQFIVNGSAQTPYETKDDFYDTENKTKTEYTYWTFRVGGFADNSVVAQVLTDALILESGIGEDGGYYTPSVDASGNLTWTKSKTSMPDISGSNIRGATGATGPTGASGMGMSDAEKQAISDAIANANGAASGANGAAANANGAAANASSAASSATSAAANANGAASNANGAAANASSAASSATSAAANANGAASNANDAASNADDAAKDANDAAANANGAASGANGAAANANGAAANASSAASSATSAAANANGAASNANDAASNADDAAKDANDAAANANGAASGANGAAANANGAAANASSAASSATSAAANANDAASNANGAAANANGAASNASSAASSATSAAANANGAAKAARDAAANVKDGATGATGQGANMQSPNVYSGLMCETPYFDIEFSTDF